MEKTLTFVNLHGWTKQEPGHRNDGCCCPECGAGEGDLSACPECNQPLHIALYNDSDVAYSCFEHGPVSADIVALMEVG